MAKGKAESIAWSVAKHDTIPAVDAWIDWPETHVYLAGFLGAQGQSFIPPYTAVRDAVAENVELIEARKRRRQAPSATVSDQRIRTWRALFESFGFFRVDPVDQAIKLTPLGRLVRSLYEQLRESVEGANDHLANLAISVLNRQLLRNPIEGGEYPDDADVHPYRFVWRAMRSLDDKLHWEEMNRVIMKVNHKRDEDAAIDHIRDVRKSVGVSYRPETVGQLGEATVDEGDETKRRITPWFTRAGFGGLLITADDDDQGFRHLVEKYKPLIDDALQDDVVVPADVHSSRETYLAFLTQEIGVASDPTTASDKSDVDRVLSAVERFGSTRVICLSGMPGTGKTRLAKLVANQLVENDPYRFAEIQFHESTSYEDFMEGFVPRPSGEGFELRPKTFRVINRRARLDPAGAPYVLLIEEFTRANVHAVLGELITYIEHRDRPFRLAVSQKEERIAPNLIVLATMNPRDKSALVLDAAIVRRLHQVPLDSSTNQLREMLSGRLGDSDLAALCEWFERFREALPFGHGAFADVQGAQDLRDVWNGTLRHFLTDLTGAIRDIYRELDEAFPWR